jgi:hypothetical protein
VSRLDGANCPVREVAGPIVDLTRSDLLASMPCLRRLLDKLLCSVQHLSSNKTQVAVSRLIHLATSVPRSASLESAQDSTASSHTAGKDVLKYDR